jgi:bacteriocin biosynthesis cyclodehydratase domain-containing protein
VIADDGGDPRAPARAGLRVLEGRVGEPTGVNRYRLRPSVELFEAADGDVYLLEPGGAPAVVVRRPERADRELLRRLAAEAVEVQPGSEQARRLAPLRAAGVLIAAPESAPLPDALAERFSRQLPYFADTGDPHDTQRRLRGAHVAVLGCGGLGTWTLGALAGLGVGRFTLIDDDTVDLSNLNRQVLFQTADLGASKVDCAARWVRGLDPEIDVRRMRRRVRGEADAAAAIEGADVLVLAADWPPYELGRWVNRACVEAGVPFVTAGQQPPVLKVGPTYMPGRGPCFACHERALAAAFPLYPELAEQRRHDPTPATTLGAASGVVGTLVALEVMHLLIGDGPVATEGRALLIDMRTLDQRWEPVERDPDCPVCCSR